MTWSEEEVIPSTVERQNVGHVLRSLDSIADELDRVVDRLEALDFRVWGLRDATLRDVVSATALDIDELNEEIRKRTHRLRQTRDRVLERQKQIRENYAARMRLRRRNGRDLARLESREEE